MLGRIGITQVLVVLVDVEELLEDLWMVVSRNAVPLRDGICSENHFSAVFPAHGDLITATEAPLVEGRRAGFDECVTRRNRSEVF